MTRHDRETVRHEFADTAAAYVLGALEPAEAEEFRAHLAQCVVCQDDVDSLTGAVNALAMTAPQYPAPARLRRRVLRAARGEPKPHRRQPPAAAWRWRAHRTSAGAALATAAVAVAAVLALLSGPDVRVLQARVSGIAGSAQLRVTGERGELSVRHLSPPPRGQVYEVWVTAPRRAPAPAGVLFSVTSAGTADLKLPVSLRGISQVTVTLEPDGGTRRPTHTPVILAHLA